MSHTYHNFILPRVVCLVLGLLLAILAIPAVSHAGLILQKPLYVGLNNGLVGYWSFDGPDMAGDIAYDRSGQGSNATLTNGPVRAIGRIGQALKLDGVNDLVDPEPNTPIINLNQRTISAWIKADTFGSNGFGAIVADGPVFEFQVRASCACLQYDHEFNLAIGRWQSPTNSIRLGQWHHVLVVFDRTSNTNDPLLYIDGISRAVTEIVTPLGVTSSETDVVFGSLDFTPNDLFNGLIDEVRIYKRALSADEIKRLYKIGATFVINKASNTGTLKDGLVGYWSFDGPDMAGVTAYDRSGQANNGTLTNGPRRTIGRIGQGLGFDGSNDYINMGSPSSLDNIDVKTISAWIKLDRFSSTGFDTIIGKADAANSNWNLNVMSGAQGTNWLAWDHSFSGTFGRWRTPANSIKLNTWHNVVLVYASSSAASDPSFYIDGIAQTVTEASIPIGNAWNDAAEALEIGVFGGASLTDFINGTLDEVRIYNRALSADEIKRLYKIGATFTIGKASNTGTLKDGLVGYWSFDGPDMAGVTAYDRSGQGNNGTLTNGPVRTIGRIGQGLEFAGSASVTIPDNAVFTLTAANKYSWSSWINPRDLANDPPNDLNFIWKQEINAGVKLFITATSNSDPNLGPVTNGVSATWNSGNGDVVDAHSINNVLKKNTWHHVVVTYDGSLAQVDRLTIYVDTVDVTDRSDVNSFGSLKDINPTDTQIGGDTTDSTQTFIGRVDEVRYYNRALSTDEIKRLYRMGGGR